MYRLTMDMPQSVLAILTVTDRPVGVGSLVEVVLCHPQKNARPDIQMEYDLAEEPSGPPRHNNFFSICFLEEFVIY